MTYIYFIGKFSENKLKFPVRQRQQRKIISPNLSSKAAQIGFTLSRGQNRTQNEAESQ